MRIKLLKNVPVEKKHGLSKGKILDATDAEKTRGRVRWWVVGDAGERVGIMEYEAEVVSDESQVAQDEIMRSDEMIAEEREERC